MIALLGGTGALPATLAAHLGREGRAVLLCELAGFPMEAPPDLPRLAFRIERLGGLLADLAGRGVTEVCLAGAVRRPAIDLAAVDAATAPLLPRLATAMTRGDDGALRGVVAILEDAGFAVRGAHELAPDLLPPPGVLSRRGPTAAHRSDAARSERAHRAIARADVGQAVVAREGQILAVEAAPGTDWMIRSLGRDRLADGAVLFKAPKEGQDRRVDLPVVGPATIAGAVEARMGAVVIEAGGVMLLDQPACVAAADAAGLVLWVREAGA